MGGTGAPVEAPRDHGAVVDDSELIWLATRTVAAAWFSEVISRDQAIGQAVFLIGVSEVSEQLEEPGGIAKDVVGEGSSRPVGIGDDGF